MANGDGNGSSARLLWLNLAAVVIAGLALFIQQQSFAQQQKTSAEEISKKHDEELKSEVKETTDQTNAISALASRVGDLSDRLQAISLGNTQRFTSIDDGVARLGKQFDTMQTTVGDLNNRLVLQEAATAAFKEELRTIVSTLTSPQKIK